MTETIPTDTTTERTVVPDSPGTVWKSSPPPTGIIGAIDFHSSEFNQTDDLNDSYGICAYESLDGVVTADMRHQQERRQQPAEPIEPSNPAPAPVQTAGEENAPARLASVTLISEGKILIIDTSPARAALCGEILSERQLTCTLMIIKTAVADTSSEPYTLPLVDRVDAVSVSGAFCGFSATVTVDGKERPLIRLSGGQEAIFDLVLDLQPVPSFAGNQPPVGYFAPGTNAAALDAALQELPRMRGRFTKPQFVDFQERACVHGRSRTRDCRRCPDICPVGAVSSRNRRVFFNHSLCQGCGACALVCATDAIRVVRPGEQSWPAALRGHFENGPAGYSPRVLISDMYDASGPDLPGSGGTDGGEDIRLQVEHIADVRMDMLLAAFACGASDVRVACDPQNQPAVLGAVDEQIRLVRTVLTGLGLSEDKVRLSSTGFDGEYLSDMTGLSGANNLDPAAIRLLPPGPFSSGDDRRAWIRLAVYHLFDHSGIQLPELALPAGAPFGAVSVNTAACTLCMACVSSCPFGALSAGADVPRLAFCEAPCRQCGICEASCPERAIRMTPRFLCMPDAVNSPRTLCEAEPFRCLECGAPFATAAMITRMREKLKGHRMYGGDRQIRRLSLCGTCRTRDTLLSEEVASWTRR